MVHMPNCSSQQCPTIATQNRPMLAISKHTAYAPQEFRSVGHHRTLTTSATTPHGLCPTTHNIRWWQTTGSEREKREFVTERGIERAKVWESKESSERFLQERERKRRERENKNNMSLLFTWSTVLVINTEYCNVL